MFYFYFVFKTCCMLPGKKDPVSLSQNITVTREAQVILYRLTSYLMKEGNFIQRYFMYLWKSVTLYNFFFFFFFFFFSSIRGTQYPENSCDC